MSLVKLRGDILKIYIDDEISDFWGISPRDLRTGIDRYRGRFTSVSVDINSPGGSVTDGIAIRNLLLDLKKDFTVNIHVSGIAASIASIIALSGSSLKMRVGTYLMVHYPFAGGMGDYTDFDNMAKTLKTITEDLITIYEESSDSLSRDEIKDFMANETWFPAEQAEEYGFATLERVLVGAEVFNSINKTTNSKTFSAFRNVPEALKTNKKPISAGGNMTLEEFLAQNNDAKEEFDARISAAKKEAAETAEKEAKAEAEKLIKDDRVRTKELFALAKIQVPEALEKAVVEGSDEKDFALALVKGDVKIEEENHEPNNSNNSVPPVTPSGTPGDERAKAEKQETEAFDKIMNSIFLSKGAK